MNVKITQLYRICVTPKVKNFLWRVCCGCFSTRARLCSKDVSCPLDCVLCNNNYEDNIHVLIECPKVVQAWHDLNL